MLKERMDNDTDTEDEAKVASDDDDDDNDDNDPAAVQGIHFINANADGEDLKPLRALPAFVRGFPRNSTENPLDSFKTNSPEKIVEYYMGPRWRHQLECMNEKRFRLHPNWDVFTYGALLRCGLPAGEMSLTTWTSK
jgi:hypothetical protein